MNAAIAQYLNVAESAIIRVEEWANVLFAVVKGIGARFVSKNVVKVKKSAKPLEVRWSISGKRIVAKRLTERTAQYKDLVGHYELFADGVFTQRVEGQKFLDGINAAPQDNFEFIY